MLSNMSFVSGHFDLPGVVYNPSYAFGIDSFGSDPEFFAVKNGEYIVPDSILKKSITKDKSVYFNTDIFGDGPVYEVYVYPSYRYLTDNVMCSYRALKMFARKEDGCSVSNDPQVEFDKNYWDTVPDFVKEIGCSPDIYLWPTRKGFWIGDAEKQELTNVRYAGGHIHVSFLSFSGNNAKTPSDKKTIYTSPLFTYLASIVIGLFVSEVYPVVLKLERKKFGKLNYTPRFASRYGVPILCRLKSYGVEIRSPSNWMLTDPEARVVLNERLYNVFKENIYDKPELDFTDVPYGEELEDMVKEFRKEFKL